MDQSNKDDHWEDDEHAPYIARPQKMGVTVEKAGVNIYKEIHDDIKKASERMMWNEVRYCDYKFEYKNVEENIPELKTYQPTISIPATNQAVPKNTINEESYDYLSKNTYAYL
jgi:hypothetical protein